MKILGIDYGRRKIGLALATATLAEAYKVVRFESIAQAIKKIKRVAHEEKIEKVVVGISEGKMAEETREFAKLLGSHLGLAIDFQDESLSTRITQGFLIQAGVKRKKRKEFEDAYAAALILQDYLDCKGKRKN